MCGLFASYVKNADKKVNKQLNLRALDSLKHRGPDWQGAYSTRDGKVFLGHNLLSISTPHAHEGRQPAKTDKSVMVFNGELYNHQDLRQQLTALGIVFDGTSDTETLLRGIDNLGWGFLDAVEGCWALVLHDLVSGKLFFARDPLGEKQLIYKVDPNGLTLASEAKAIGTVGGPLGLSGERIFSDLVFDFFSNRESTYFNGLKNCLPGKVYQYDPHQTAPQVIHTTRLGPNHPVAPLRRTLAHAVSSMVPEHHAHAVVLSGGLDSSIIASLLKTERLDQPFVAITAAYVDGDNEDLRCAKQLANHLGRIDHHILQIGSDDIEQHFEATQHALEEPLHDQVYVAQYLIYKHISNLGLRVAFNGQGADEFWGGYYHHYNLQKLYRLADHEQVINHFHHIAERRGLLHLLTRSEIGTLIEHNLAPRWTDSTTLQNILMEGHLQAMLSHEDKLSMASGVEVRLPFLNQELVRHALDLSNEEKVRHGIEKSPLRAAMKGILLDQIRLRRKQAFPDAPKTAYLKLPALQRLAATSGFFSTSDIKHIAQAAPAMEWRMNAVNAFSGAIARGI